LVVFKVTGKNAAKSFKHESGGHRWQRVPPTERGGRVHTSTITVAVLEEVLPSEIKINEKDLDIKATRGSGAGGQHKNVTDSAIQLTHKPSGIKIRCEAGRSQHANKEQALELLRIKLKEAERTKTVKEHNNKRKSQVGTGMRGDKIRTIRLQDDIVTDHRTNKRMSAKKYIKGQIELLF
jgi:peptide chain release factor 1